jgi:hypothetical protein
MCPSYKKKWPHKSNWALELQDKWLEKSEINTSFRKLSPQTNLLMPILFQIFFIQKVPPQKSIVPAPPFPGPPTHGKPAIYVNKYVRKRLNSLGRVVWSESDSEQGCHSSAFRRISAYVDLKSRPSWFVQIRWENSWVCRGGGLVVSSILYVS